MTTNTQRQLVFVHCKQNDQKSIIKQTYVRKILIVWTNLQFQGQLACFIYVVILLMPFIKTTLLHNAAKVNKHIISLGVKTPKNFKTKNTIYMSLFNETDKLLQSFRLLLRIRLSNS